jgi:hypothetical protein
MIFFGKPVSTFPDHALARRQPSSASTSVPMMPVPVMMMVATMMVVAMVVPRRSVIAGARDPVAGLHPAEAVPDRPTDRADVLGEVTLARHAQRSGARQRQGFGPAGNKRRCGRERQGDSGGN